MLRYQEWRAQVANNMKPLVLLFAMAACYLVFTSIRAWHKPLWFDEIITVLISREDSLARVWRDEISGADYNPPVIYLLTKIASQLGRSELFMRLPAIAGYLVMMACLCIFIARRLSLVFALPAIAFVLLARSYDYAYEARPYGAVLACTALALISWQTAGEPNASDRSRRLGLAGLALALGTGLLLHCYAVLLYIPVGIGELWRTWTRRRIDVALWAALALSLLPLSIYPYFLRATRGVVFGGTVFPRLRGLPGAYAFLMRPAILPLMIILLPLCVFAYRRKAVLKQAAAELMSRVPAYERAAVIAFLLLPFCPFVVARVLGSSYTLRYGMPAVLGFAILLAFLTYVFGCGRAGWAQWVAACALIWFVGSFEIDRREWDHQKAIRESNKRDIIAASASGRPVVVSNGNVFVELAYYLPQDAASRLVYLDDPQLAIRHTGTSLIDFTLIPQMQYLPIPGHLEPYRNFMERNKRFWLYSPDQDLLEWTRHQLQIDGATLHATENKHLYDVEVTNGGQVSMSAK